MNLIFWKDIAGFEGLYRISSNGQVKALKKRRGIANTGNVRTYDEKIMKPSRTRNGYLLVCLYKEGRPFYFTVHSLVAAHYVANPGNKPQVNHLLGDKEDNWMDALEWTTASENQLHAFMIGKQPGAYTSERNPSSKIVINLESGIFYSNAKQACDSYGRGFNYEHFIRVLNNKYPNQTPFRFV